VALPIIASGPVLVPWLGHGGQALNAILPASRLAPSRPPTNACREVKRAAAAIPDGVSDEPGEPASCQPAWRRHADRWSARSGQRPSRSRGPQQAERNEHEHR
jgi:hypothetical protein